MGYMKTRFENEYRDTASDTVVSWSGHPCLERREAAGDDLADAYLRAGVQFASKITGPFAIHIHRPADDVNVLARDPMGCVPLYFSESPEDGSLACADRIAPLVSDRSKRALHPPALLDFLAFMWPVDGKTFFDGVRLVPPGTVMAFRSGSTPETFSCPIGTPPQDRLDKQSLLVQIRETLETAVVQAIRTDTGCHLSGGVDSSVVTVLAAGHAIPKPPAFVAAFPEYSADDESPFAQLAADRAGVELHRSYARPEDLPRVFNDMMQTIEEPKCHPPVFPRFLLEAVAARHGCRNLLSGRGADELFTGYDWHNDAQLVEHRARRTVFSREARARLLRADFLRAADYDPETAYEEVFAACGGETLLERILEFDRKTILANWLILDHKISRRFGIEPVSPFLDARVAKLACSIPVDLRREDGRPKALLKQAVRGLIPDEVIDRKKFGFRTPFGEMLRNGLEAFVRSELATDTSAFWEVFEPSGVHALVDNHFSGRHNFGWQLWAVMGIREWFRVNVD